CSRLRPKAIAIGRSGFTRPCAGVDASGRQLARDHSTPALGRDGRTRLLAARFGERRQHEARTRELFQRDKSKQRRHGIARLLRHQYVAIAVYRFSRLDSRWDWHDAESIQLGGPTDRMTAARWF